MKRYTRVPLKAYHFFLDCVNHTLRPIENRKSITFRMKGKVMVDTENALVTRSFNSFYHTVNTNYMIRKSFQSRVRS